ncbi:MAG TPA: glycoside hydrolase [Mycobacteriales bacterium]|nr:glycoside hydrolase [Mycobacteriales bacterium]
MTHAISRLVHRITGSDAGPTSTPDPTRDWGTWKGWGTSLAWWANVYGDRDVIHDLVAAFFTTGTATVEGHELPGLGLTIARYNAGGCATRPVGGDHMQVSPNIPPWKQIEGYWLDDASTDPGSASWDWAADPRQRAVLRLARDAGADRFELFSNSPMWWMLENHNPSGAADGSDNLTPGHYRNHARYLATIAAYAREHWGIDFASVEAFNEPSSGRWKADGTQEGCHIGADVQQLVIPLLRAELDARGLRHTPIAASDEVNYDSARSTWGRLSDEARGIVDRINVHGYQQHDGRRDLLYANAHKAGKDLWNSEYGEHDPTGITMAGNLSLDMRWLHPTAWVYWQVIDGNNWGLIAGDQDTATLGAVNTKYFVLAQYTRHIRPGMQILPADDTDTVAAFDRATARLVLVTLNTDQDQRRNYDLSKFSTVGGRAQNWTTVGDGSTLYGRGPDIEVAERRFSADFPANSVRTFVLDGVTAR